MVIQWGAKGGAEFCTCLIFIDTSVKLTLLLIKWLLSMTQQIDIATYFFDKLLLSVPQGCVIYCKTYLRYNWSPNASLKVSIASSVALPDLDVLNRLLALFS